MLQAPGREVRTDLGLKGRQMLAWGAEANASSPRSRVQYRHQSPEGAKDGRDENLIRKRLFVSGE